MHGHAREIAGIAAQQVKGAAGLAVDAGEVAAQIARLRRTGHEQAPPAGDGDDSNAARAGVPTELAEPH